MCVCVCDCVCVVCVFVRPPQSSSSSSAGLQECIWLPVYSSSERVKVVAQVALPSGANPSQWIQTGAALFLKQL